MSAKAPAENGTARLASTCRPSAAASDNTLGGKRLVFIVGAPRSGTTWLQLMLGASSKVATANETHLFSSYLSSLFHQWEARKANKRRALGLHPILSEEEFHALIRGFASGVMERILARKPDATVVLEKSPIHVRWWREILTIFPDAHFLQLIRDPRAVATSLRAAYAGWGSTWASPRLVDNCAVWSRAMSAGVEIAANTRNYRTVRYEDLHEHGGESLQTIFAWLGVDVSAGECGRIFDDYRMQTLRSKPPPTASWNIAAEPAEFFRRGATNSWHQDLTRNEIYLVETLTREMMERHGYRPEVSSTPWRRAIIWRALLLQYIRAGLEWRLRQLADDLRERV